MLQLCCNESDFYYPQTAPLSPERCVSYHKTEQCYLRISVLVWCQVHRSHITQTGGSDQAAHSIGNLEQLGDGSYTTIPYMKEPNKKACSKWVCHRPAPPEQSRLCPGLSRWTVPDCGTCVYWGTFTCSWSHIYTHTHTRAPVLCKQKEHVQTLYPFCPGSIEKWEVTGSFSASRPWCVCSCQ